MIKSLADGRWSNQHPLGCFMFHASCFFDLRDAALLICGGMKRMGGLPFAWCSVV